MASVSDLVERRLRLKVNTAKSAVAQPQERHFLGFSLWREPLDDSVKVGLSKRTKERIDSIIRELTPRNWGHSPQACIAKITAYVIGWMGFFGICTKRVENSLRALDVHI
ncbi:MAG: group II intron maturase-specific domain-containing protein, partial [Rhodoferax sp.]